MTTFDEYRQKTSDLSPDLFLGRLTWYTLAESSHVDHADFCKILIEEGIETLPGQPRPSDVFKRACTASNRKRVPTGDPNVFLNFLIRDVGKDSDNIWRRLVEERVDNEGHKLAYTEVYSLHFTRSTQQIDVEILDANVAGPEAAQIIDNVRSVFNAMNNMLTPYAIRELTRKILQTLNATVVRPSGGVYFIREEHCEMVEALERVINSLPGGSSMHSLPLLDDDKQRAMLKRAFEDESIGEIDRLLGEMGEILRNKEVSITSDRFADFKVQHDFLLAKVRDYSDLLNEAMDETGSRLEIMNDVLFELLGRVKI